MCNLRAWSFMGFYNDRDTPSSYITKMARRTHGSNPHKPNNMIRKKDLKHDQLKFKGKGKLIL